MKTSVLSTSSALVSFPSWGSPQTSQAFWLIHDTAGIANRGASLVGGNRLNTQVVWDGTHTHTKTEISAAKAQRQGMLRETHKDTTCRCTAHEQIHTHTHSVEGKPREEDEEISLSFTVLTDAVDVWPQTKQPSISSLQERLDAGEAGEEFYIWRSKHSGVFSLS